MQTGKQKLEMTLTYMNLTPINLNDKSVNTRHKSCMLHVRREVRVWEPIQNCGTNFCSGMPD